MTPPEPSDKKTVKQYFPCRNSVYCVDGNRNTTFSELRPKKRNEIKKKQCLKLFRNNETK